MTERKSQSLLTGAGVLAIATVIVKLIGALYKIPLTNLIGVEGFGYFTGAYAVYTPVYAISMAGLPVAVAKMVSQSVEQGKIKDAQLIFKISKKIFFFIGIFCTALLIAFAVPYSNSALINTPDNYISIWVISPCIFFCCLMSAYRGYYEGLNNMTPTGVSQVIEAVTKLLFGLAGAYAFMKWSLSYYHENAVDGVMVLFGRSVTDEATALSVIYPYAAAVAVMGVTLGSVFGFIYLYILFKIKGDGFTRQELVNSQRVRDKKDIIRELVTIAVPVAVSSLILNLTNIIDELTIKGRLAYALETGGGVIENMYADSFEKSQTLFENIPVYLYGINGSVNNIRNLIPTITLTLGISAIPVLSKAWTAKDKKAVKLSCQSALRVTMMLALPAGLGIAALSEPILDLLYSSTSEIVPIAAPMLRFCGYGMFLFAAASPLTNMLQAVGNTKAPIISIAAGSVAKFIYNWIFIADPQINIKGAMYGSVLCYFIMTGLNLIQLIKTTGIKLDFISVFIKPLVAAAFCGGAAKGVFTLLYENLALSSKLSCIISIGAGATVYAIVLLFIKGIAKDDVEMLPKGKKIAKVLEKFKVLG
ncbi:MAG: polysaccharide biosynthesis C-terminal domain-containing protein [Acutalibacteraceae bacterium]